MESFLSIDSPLNILIPNKVMLWSISRKYIFDKLKDKLTFTPVLTLLEDTDGFFVMRPTWD